MRYDAGHHLHEMEKGRFGIRLGKWRLPYNRARQESLFKLQFTSRSMASGLFDINRSVGGSLWGRTDLWGRPADWEVAVFHGFSTQGARPFRSGNHDRNFGTAARIAGDVLGEWGDDGTLGRSEQSADEIAGGLAWYIRGHRLKLVVDVTHLNGAPLREPRLNIIPGEAG